ncbi:hypothetical protein BOW52_08090 [Solemya elarraichensis gill symbiont]|uniref:Uncharacterized protein n=2 Tax=Solemya elarraichensis gill symbiont TaxID=1918949 RepID=A0A1T2L0Z5_9GAMM|nr:hypothetical protein BOW52_08090 [Solemya elarraichensis gill symbiont]
MKEWNEVLVWEEGGQKQASVLQCIPVVKWHMGRQQKMSVWVDVEQVDLVVEELEIGEETTAA